MPKSKNVQKYKDWDEEQVSKDQGAMTSGSAFWKAKEGRNVVRFLPALSNWPHGPFMIVSEHIIQMPAVGIRSFPCPRILAKKPCPVCVKAEELNNSTSKKDKDAASAMFARRQVYSNIIDRAMPDKGPQTFKFGKTVWDGLRGVRDESGDFTHPVKGFDIIIRREGSSKDNTRYSVLPGKPGPLGNDEWIEQQRQPKPPEIYTPERIQAMLGGEEDEEDVQPSGKRLGPGGKKGWDDEDNDVIDVGGDDDEPDPF